MCTNEIGFGLGLRPEHYEEIAAHPGKVSWFEALSENYMVPGGSPLHWLDRIRKALDEESFVLYCQPIARIDGGEIPLAKLRSSRSAQAGSSAWQLQR